MKKLFCDVCGEPALDYTDLLRIATAGDGVTVSASFERHGQRGADLCRKCRAELLQKAVEESLKR